MTPAAVLSIPRFMLADMGQEAATSLTAEMMETAVREHPGCAFEWREDPKTNMYELVPA